MRLFEITTEFVQMFEAFDQIIDAGLETGESDTAEEDIWFEMLTDIEGAFEEKAESVAQFVKELNARAKAIEQEEKTLKARRQVYEHKADRLKKYLQDCMVNMKLKKVETPKVKITVRNNSPSVDVQDEKALAVMLLESGRNDLLKAPEISKTAIKNCINAGERFEGVKLTVKQSIIIK